MDSDQNHQEKDDLLNLKRVIEPELARLEVLILFHKPQENDQDFDEYVNKAIYYRDILKRIHLDLAKLNK